MEDESPRELLEGIWRRAARDLKERTIGSKVFLLFDGLISAITTAVGDPAPLNTLLETSLGLQQPGAAEALMFIIAFLGMFAFAFAWHVFRAPLRQRDEARQQLLREPLDVSYSATAFARMHPPDPQWESSIELRQYNHGDFIVLRDVRITNQSSTPMSLDVLVEVRWPDLPPALTSRTLAHSECPPPEVLERVDVTLDMERMLHPPLNIPAYSSTSSSWVAFLIKYETLRSMVAFQAKSYFDIEPSEDQLNKTRINVVFRDRVSGKERAFSTTGSDM